VLAGVGAGKDREDFVATVFALNPSSAGYDAVLEHLDVQTIGGHRSAFSTARRRRAHSSMTRQNQSR
jgi:hypothetical protein